MIGLDTNVLVRYLIKDEPIQAAAAAAVINSFTEKQPGYLSLVTVVELYWVLTRAYGLTTERCADLMVGLLNSSELSVDHDSTVRQAVAKSRKGCDFADAIIAELGREAGCEYTLTFDRSAARSGLMRRLAPDN